MSLINQIKQNNCDVASDAPCAKQDCSDVLHISMYFDGTGNNKEADEIKKQWANPARLWRSAMQYIFDNDQKDNPINAHAIYVSGVGTRFNGELNIFERGIATLEDKSLGNAAGLGGTRRLDYGESQFNHALNTAIKINTERADLALGRYANQKKTDSFLALEKKLGQHRLIKKINMSIFGFSRGAALARAFNNQLIFKCKSSADGLTYGESDSPIDFKFLGLFDTVASFGLPATNLSNYTFQNRDLVVDPRVKMCVHYIAGNELRFSFPVDLINKKNGESANKNWKEIVYPGMHSDVGGGYAPDDQGVSDNFARIPLKAMLDEAVNAGVRMYGYDELKEKHKKTFQAQFEIQEQTQKIFDRVFANMQPHATAESQITASMKLYYSAYGTLARSKTQSVSQKIRAKSPIRELIPIGASDMATEIERLEKLKAKSTSPSEGKKHFKVALDMAGLYQKIISVDDWEMQSWKKQASPDAQEFYQNYVHDSKYGFIGNAEPFSYFSQRRVYESHRSRKGKEIDQQKLKHQTAAAQHIDKAISQKEFLTTFKQATANNEVTVATA